MTTYVIYQGDVFDPARYEVYKQQAALEHRRRGWPVRGTRRRRCRPRGGDARGPHRGARLPDAAGRARLVPQRGVHGGPPPSRRCCPGDALRGGRRRRGAHSPAGPPARGPTAVGRVAAMAEHAGTGDTVSLYEGLLTTRAIRRYTDEPVPDEVLRDILFAATRAPSGSNRQPFRFIVLTDGPVAREAKRLIGEGARKFWAAKREADGYDTGSGAEADSPKARMARTMQHYVDTYESVPVLDPGLLRALPPHQLHRRRVGLPRLPEPAAGRPRPRLRRRHDRLAVRRRRRAARPAAHPRRGRAHGDHHPRPPAGPARPGAAAAPPRAGLRRALGRGPRLGGRPGGGRAHGGGATRRAANTVWVLRPPSEG